VDVVRRERVVELAVDDLDLPVFAQDRGGTPAGKSLISNDPLA